MGCVSSATATNTATTTTTTETTTTAATNAANPANAGIPTRVMNTTLPFTAALSNAYFDLEKISEEEQKAELAKPYPAFGQGFGNQKDQIVLPPVNWKDIPMTSGLPDGQKEQPWSPIFNDIVKNYMTQYKLPGGVHLCMVTNINGKPKVLFNTSYGVRSMTDPNVSVFTPDCLTFCGSVSKTITSVGVMCLIEDGKVTLDTPIFDLLCQAGNVTFKLSDARVAHITVKMCMNHTAGFGDETMGTVGTDTSTCKKAAELLSNISLNCDPGSSHQYSNLGPNLLGRVIEACSGNKNQHYEQFIQTRVFEPLNIQSLVHTNYNSTYSNTPMLSSSSKNHQPSPMEACTFTPTQPGTVKDDLSDLKWKYLFGGPNNSQQNKEIGMGGAGGWKMTALHVAAMGADLMNCRDQPDGTANIWKKQSTATMFFSSTHGCPNDSTYGDSKQGWYGLGTIAWAPDKTKCNDESTCLNGGAQWMHGGSYGSALHMCYSRISWYFALTAQPHFSGAHTIHHISGGANGQGLKDLIRNATQMGKCTPII